MYDQRNYLSSTFLLLISQTRATLSYEEITKSFPRNRSPIKIVARMRCAFETIHPHLINIIHGWAACRGGRMDLQDWEERGISKERWKTRESNEKCVQGFVRSSSGTGIFPVKTLITSRGFITRC